MASVVKGTSVISSLQSHSPKRERKGREKREKKEREDDDVARKAGERLFVVPYHGQGPYYQL